VVPRHLDREQKQLLRRLAESLEERNLRSDDGLMGKLRRLVGAQRP
jgi:hypothetical protein